MEGGVSDLEWFDLILMQPLTLKFSWDQLNVAGPVCRAPSLWVPKVIHMSVDFHWCPWLLSLLLLHGH